MKNYITKEEYREVEVLVNCAITARNKAEATKYIERLEFLASFYEGYTGIVFSNLVSSTKRASGQVADKNRLISFCNQDLWKLEHQIKETE